MSISAFLGMTTSEARRCAAGTRTAAAALSALRGALEGTVTSAPWHGPDADAFRARWQAEASPSLDQLARVLQHRAEELQTQADAQDAASEPAGVGGPGGMTDGWLLGAAQGSPGSATDPRGLWRAALGPGPVDPELAVILSEEARERLRDLLERAGDSPLGRSLRKVIEEQPPPGIRADVELMDAARAALQIASWMRTAPLDGEWLLHMADAPGLPGMLHRWAIQGDAPTVAEVGATLLMAEVSTRTGLITAMNDDPFFRNRNDVEVTAVRDLHTGGVGESVMAGRAPHSLSELLMGSDEARRDMFPPGLPQHGYDPVSAGQVRIQEVRGTEGGAAYIVYAPPTSGAPMSDIRSWGAQGNPSDWPSNMHAMSGAESSSMAQLRTAMAATGPDGQPLIPPGADVMIVAHSQGGLAAGRLTEDPTFNSSSGAPGTYNITHAFSAGSPVEAVTPVQDGTRILNLSHHRPEVLAGNGIPALASVPGDPVAMLDAGGYRLDGSGPSPQVQDVSLPTPVPERFAPDGGLHSYLRQSHDTVLRDEQGVDPSGGYYGSARAHEGSHPELLDFQEDLQGRYLGPDVSVTSDVVVEVQRVE